jgi:hypothetical protein
MDDGLARMSFSVMGMAAQRTRFRMRAHAVDRVARQAQNSARSGTTVSLVGLFQRKSARQSAPSAHATANSALTRVAVEGQPCTQPQARPDKDSKP